MPNTNATRGQRTGLSTKSTSIIKVGYTGDLQHADNKLAQKTTQHARLKEELTRAGWTVHYTESQIVNLGSTGTLTYTRTETILAAPVQPIYLGTTAEDAHKACLQIIGKR
jgi:hypothetical protein